MDIAFWGKEGKKKKNYGKTGKREKKKCGEREAGSEAEKRGC